MDLESRKQDLINHILRGFTEDDFNAFLVREQQRGHDNVEGYHSYDEVVRKQVQIVNQFNEDSIRTLEVIKQLTTGGVYIVRHEDAYTEPLNFFLGRDGHPIFLTYI